MKGDVMTYKTWLGITLGLIVVIGGCGLIEEPVENTPITEIHHMITENFLLLDNLTIEQTVGVEMTADSMIQGFNSKQEHIKNTFNEVLGTICIAGVLSIDRDQNSYPINGVYTFLVDETIIETIKTTCDSRAISAGNTITITVQDTQTNKSDTYVKHLIIDLGDGAISHYDIRHNNSNINILMTEKATESNTAGYDYRTIIDYDPKNNILKTEYLSVSDISTNTSIDFYRTYSNANKAYVSSYENDQFNTVYFATGSKDKYKLSTDKNSWKDAHSECVLEGGYLAHILSETAHDNLINLCFSGTQDDDCWIGLNDLETEGELKWAGGTSSTDYSNSNYNKDEDVELIINWQEDGRDCFHLEAHYSGRKIEGNPCSTQAKFICEFSNSTQTQISFLELNSDESEMNRCINRDTGIDSSCDTQLNKAESTKDLVNSFVTLLETSGSWIDNTYKLTFESETLESDPLSQ